MASSAEEWIGQEVANGRYNILSRIGQGSMGQVYLVRDQRLETDVVIKFPFAGEKLQTYPGATNRSAPRPPNS